MWMMCVSVMRWSGARAHGGGRRALRACWLAAAAVLCAGAGAGALLPPAPEDPAAGLNYTWPLDVQLKDGATYDYIVVGAGAAGCAAAARLALAGHSVLLLEAGPSPPPLTKIPVAATVLTGSSVDWQYPTLPNNASCLSKADGACRFNRGKCLGGSTSINYMLYSRGSRRDYEYALPGWSWRELEPYFLRAEGLQALAELPRSSARYHNTTGPVKLEFFAAPENPWQARIHRAYRELAFPANRDVNAASQIGVSRLVGYVHRGERMSAARAYLARADVRRRLHVATDTLCARVLLDAGNAARGVAVLTGAAQRPLQLRARREVVLSAGTVGTPHILMLSGIGPAAHLEAAGVPVRLDSPVGEDMSDHVLPLVVILVDRDWGPAREVKDLLDKLMQPVQFLREHAGPLASIGVTDINAFVNTRCYDAQRRRLGNESDECTLPSVQFIHSYIGRKIIPLVRAQFQRATGFTDDVVEQLAAANVNNAFLVVTPVVLSAHSRGHIRLASRDPRDPPAIFPNYLADERDVDEMLRAIRIIEHLAGTGPFREGNARILRLRLAGCAGRGAQYWRCYVRHMTHAGWHAAGTCALGRVLDARLRVRGAARLRVADASALRRAPRGNTAAAAIALGERVADFILEDSHN